MGDLRFRGLGILAFGVCRISCLRVWGLGSALADGASGLRVRLVFQSLSCRVLGFRAAGLGSEGLGFRLLRLWVFRWLN